MFLQINPTTLPTIFPPARFSSISSILDVIIPLIIIIASLVLLGIFIVGAYRVITMGGDAEKFQQTKQLFKYAILGFGIIVLSFLIIKIISFITGIKVPL